MLRIILTLLCSLQLWFAIISSQQLETFSTFSLVGLAGASILCFLTQRLLGKTSGTLSSPHRSQRLLQVITQNITRNKRHFLLAGIGIAVGITTLVFFLALGGGVRKIVLGEIFPIEQLEVVAPRVEMAVGPLQLGNSSVALNDETVAKLKQVPGVKGVYPKMKIAFPARAWGGKKLIGKNAGAELLGDGVAPGLVAEDAKRQGYDFEDLEGAACSQDTDCGTGGLCGSQKTCEPRSCNQDTDCGEGWYCDLGDPEWSSYVGTKTCHRPIPVFISTQLFELMNSTFLPANGFPKVNREFLVGKLGFSIYLGYSTLGNAKQGRPVLRRTMLAGFSTRAIPIGITLPLPYVKRWNAEFAGEDKAKNYSSILVEVQSKEDVSLVAGFIKNDLKLDIVDSGAEQAGLVITIITLIFGLISVTIVGIAAINIMNTFFMLVSERRREIGLLRSLGASQGDIRNLLLTEAAIIGALSGMVGLCLAYDLGMLVNWVNSTPLVPDFPFKPTNYFVFSLELLLGALLFAVLCCVLGAFVPAKSAAKIDPVRAMTSA